MLPLDLTELTASHIESLVESEVPESLTLEYKQELPSQQSEKKREFLYDIAAMANAAGGDLVYGIAERRTADDKPTGIPERLAGVRHSNIQEEIIRLSNYIRDGVSPTLSGVVMQPVSCPGGDTLVIRIPSGWSKPHMVTMGGADKFYKRAGATKNPMSVDEIRRSFSEQGELRETLARWRAHRVELILQRRGPVLLSGEVAMLFHIIPVEAFTSGRFTEAWRLPDNEKKQVFVMNGNLNQRYNADGFLCHSSSANLRSAEFYGYTQLFRSGIVEYAAGNFLRPHVDLNIPLICGQELEQVMVLCYEDAMRRFRTEGRAGSIYVGFSLIGIEGKKMFTTLMTWFDPGYGIGQNVFTSPEVLVELIDPEERPYDRTLRPLVDTLWQIAGRERTPFLIEGKWYPFGNYR
jgi:hypothetical protein